MGSAVTSSNNDVGVIIAEISWCGEHFYTKYLVTTLRGGDYLSCGLCQPCRDMFVQCQIHTNRGRSLLHWEGKSVESHRAEESTHKRTFLGMASVAVAIEEVPARVECLHVVSPVRDILVQGAGASYSDFPTDSN